MDFYPNHWYATIADRTAAKRAFSGQSEATDYTSISFNRYIIGNNDKLWRQDVDRRVVGLPGDWRVVKSSATYYRAAAVGPPTAFSYKKIARRNVYSVMGIITLHDRSPRQFTRSTMLRQTNRQTAVSSEHVRVCNLY